MRSTGSLVVVWVALACACGPEGDTDSGKACAVLQPNDLRFSEVMIDPDGIDTGAEWVEVYNALPHAIDLEGLNVSSGAKKMTLDSTQLGPNGYALISTEKLGSLANSAGELALSCGGTQLDTFEWATAGRSGHSRSYDFSAATWCDSKESNGSPGEANTPCVSGLFCLDVDGASRQRQAPIRGDLIITEVMASPKAAVDSAGEWFEVFASRTVDLNDVTVVTSTGDSIITSEACLSLAAGTYGLIARSADRFLNGGLPSPSALFSNSIGGNNERLSLFAFDSGLDEVAIYKSTSGVSWQLDSRATLHPSSNDDPAAFCASVKPWADGGVDVGTPGQPNVACASSSMRADAGSTAPSKDAGVAVPGQTQATCIDPSTRKSRVWRVPKASSLAVTEVMANPGAVGDDVGEWFEVLALAAFDLNGLTLGNDGTASLTVTDETCRPVAAGTSLLFARKSNAAENGGLVNVTAPFSFSLGNTGTRFIRVSHAGVELARLAYSSTVSGVSLQQDPTTAKYCLTPSTSTFGDGAPKDRGTPGNANVRCQ